MINDIKYFHKYYSDFIQSSRVFWFVTNNTFVLFLMTCFTWSKREKNCFTASINKSFSAYCSSKLCLPCYAGDNEMLYFGKFHLQLLGNPNMLHAPNNHIVCQCCFQNCNQSRVHLLIGCKVDKLDPHIFLQSLFLKTSVFLKA